MTQFRLTKKFAQDCKIETLSGPLSTTNIFDDWIVDVFFIERKKIAIITHIKTLLTFFTPYESRDAIVIPSLANFFLQAFLKENKYDNGVINNLEKLFLEKTCFVKTDGHKAFLYVNNFKDLAKKQTAQIKFRNINWDSIANIINTSQIYVEEIGKTNAIALFSVYVKKYFSVPEKKKKTINYIPQAVFDNTEFLKSDDHPAHLSAQFKNDFKQAKQFLLSYKNNDATFNSFRREIERFAQYCWFVVEKNMCDMNREKIEEYLLFCQKPPTAWISNLNVPRFIVDKNGFRISNKKWRPFLITISKSERKDGKTPNRRDYQLSEKAFREIFTILNCYYNFLIQEEFSQINPIMQIKQKNRFYRSHQTKAKVRRISEFQWKTVLETAEKMAKDNPEKHERTLFFISILYGMYLRISELAASERWTPTMNDFSKDHDDHWWFTTVGKGNKERQIAVSPPMLTALKRWREHLKLSPALPLPNDNSPLIPKMRGNLAMSDTSHIRKIVQCCFDEAIFELRKRKLEEDAQELSQATVHWLRHTGISDDVKIRPREHVRDDAGHSSSSITDKYIDINLNERHASARKKSLK